MFKASQTLLPLSAILLSAVLPIAALISATPASARPASASTEPVRVVVNHGDLDLTDASDVAVLDQRIRSSVKRACPVMTRNLRETAHAARCRKSAAARALQQKDVAIASAQANRPQFASANDTKAVAAQ
ncbi:UrcA family protein [Sphingopyxis fribergensis]